MEGFEFRDTGIGTATKGLAGVRVVRPLEWPKPLVCSHSGEFYFLFYAGGWINYSSARDSDPKGWMPEIPVLSLLSNVTP